MTAFDLPQQPRRIQKRTVAIPALSAMVLAAVVSLAEIRTVAVAWNTCDVGINASANAYYLLLITLPVLWLAQTVMIAVPAPLLALLSRRRLVVTAAMALLACIVVISVAWAFFAWSGLPINGAPCPGTQPTWWPEWLPPSPRPFY